jgi:hypothetical protein
MGMGLFLFLLTWLVAGDLSAIVLLATLLIFVEVLTVMAVTVFFSTFTSALLASVLGVCVFIAGQLSHNVLSLSRLGHSAPIKALSWVIWVLVPNFPAVDIKPAVVGEGTVAWGSVTLWVAYLAAYMVVVLLLAGWIFRGKEF